MTDSNAKVTYAYRYLGQYLHDVRASNRTTGKIDFTIIPTSAARITWI